MYQTLITLENDAKLNPYFLRGFDYSDYKFELNQWIVDFFDTYNHEYPTIDALGGFICSGGNRNRSLGDIYRIAVGFNPNITVKELLVGLYNEDTINNINKGSYILCEVPLKSTHRLVSLYCSDVHKRVYKTTTKKYNLHNNGWAFDHQSRLDEFNLRVEDYLDIIKTP